MKKISIFASGSGTNAENIIKYFYNDDDIKVVSVLSNKQDSQVLQRVKKYNVPSFSFPTSDFKSGLNILDHLHDYQTDFIILAGFMNLISPVIIDAFHNKIINIHPALLPKFGGKGMYGHFVHESVLAAKETESGITIHHINNQYDEGKIIFQVAIPIKPNTSVSDLEHLIHTLEYKYYPFIIRKLV